MAILASRTPRERILIALAVLLIAGAAFYRLWWTPVAAERAALRAQIAVLDKTLAQARIGGIQGGAVAETNRPPPAQRVTRSAVGAGVSIRRLEPEDTRLRLSVGETGFETLLRWLAELESTQGLRIAAAEIDRRPEPGVVTARLILEPL